MLFQEYPKLYKGFTFWQRLHYFMVGFYYLRGVVALVDIAVPIICLSLGTTPLRTDLPSFLKVFGPLAVIVLVVRQIAQRWVIEKYERGYHFVGGVLALGCWWVFLQGFLCAVFRRKGPYIPTPKDNTPVDNWQIAMPNLIAGGLSLAAVVYGLSMDLTPFSLLMAAFAIANAVQLLFVALIAQQRTLQRIQQALVRAEGGRDSIVGPIIAASRRVKHASLKLVRERALTVSLLVVAAALIVNFWPKSRVPEEPGQQFRETGGFYVGAALPGSIPALFRRALRRPASS